MERSVCETARLAGVSVRTLHYYDRIGLLRPSAVSAAGYRSYDDAALARLQQILFFRELGFPLKEIARILSHPDYDTQLALRRRRELLLLERQRLDAQLALVEQTLGGTDMKKPIITAADVDAARRTYADEARQRWGTGAEYAESARRDAARTPALQDDMLADMDAIFAGFAALRGADPAGAEAQALVRRWQDHITRYHYPCSAEILACLGQMYTADARFTANLDRFGEGTARFMSEAIAAYCAAQH